jgi:hypothetical protein
VSFCKKNKTGGKHASQATGKSTGKHAGKKKEVGSTKPGRRERKEGVPEPKPEHSSSACPRNTKDASSRRGKQGLTIYTCNGCGNIWSQ